jgi:hypothetical protein
MQIDTPVSHKTTNFEHITQIVDRLGTVIAICDDPKVADALVATLNNPNKTKEDTIADLFDELFS